MKIICKIFFASALVAANVAFFSSAASAAGALYTLNIGPYDVENLGEIFHSAEEVGGWINIQMSNGDVHSIRSFNRAPFQLLDANITQNTFRIADGTPGGFWRQVFHLSQQKLYIGTNYANYFSEYDPQSGTLREIGRVADGGGTQDMIIGDDQAIYIGECCTGLVQRYDPAADILESAVDMDPDGGTYQYAYYVGADSRYTFAALGQSPWYLAIYDRQTETKNLYFKEDGDTGGFVTKKHDGNWYYRRTNTWGTKWYILSDGVPQEISLGEVPADISCNQGIRNWGGNCYGYETTSDDEYPPNELTGNKASIKWRPVGQIDWQSIEATGFTLPAVTIKRLYAQENSEKLFATTYGYNPVIEYDLSNSETNLVGFPKIGVYDALFDSSNIYFAGYPTATERYDSNKPWTLTSKNMSWDTNNPNDTNPYVIPPRIGKYHYYLAKGYDGLIYIGSHHERDSTGGDLLWYDPETGSPGNLREPFVDYDVTDLQAVLGGTKLAYSSMSVDPSDDGKLFIFDVATKQVEREITITPAAVAGSAGKIIEIEPGIVLGVIKAADPAKSQIYKVNISTGEIYFNNSYSERAFANRSYFDDRIVKGPDGYAWLQMAGNIVRINPADGSVEKILLNQTGNPVFFKNTDLYLALSTNLKRVKGIFSAVYTPNPPSPPTEKDIVSPVCSNGFPGNEIFPPGTVKKNLRLTTDENAVCKYSSVAGTPFVGMKNTFGTTGGRIHKMEISGLTDGVSYNYYVKCRDRAGNNNSSDYKISFSVASAEFIPSIALGKRKICNISSRKTVYLRANKMIFRGKLANYKKGKVQIIENGKVKKEKNLNSRGKWRIRIKEKRKNCSHDYQFKYFDSRGREMLISDYYHIIIDRIAPKFSFFPKKIEKNPGDSVYWEVIDNDQIKYYSYKFRGGVYKTRENSFTLPVDIKRGKYHLKVKAYDRAENRGSCRVRIIVK